MDIVIVGNGNVATVFGRLFISKGHRIVGVVARKMETANALAAEWESAAFTFESVQNMVADMVVVALSDEALSGVLPALNIQSKYWVHTAGSVPMQVLEHLAENYGVLYPLQSLSKKNGVMPEIPFLVNGNSPAVQNFLVEFARTLSPMVAIASDEQRLMAHVSAVFVSNFSNHLYRLAQNFSDKHHLNFNFLLPLMMETVSRLKNYKAADVQTGPAVRNDIITINKHLEILKPEPEMEKVYRFLSESILRTNINCAEQ